MTGFCHDVADFQGLSFEFSGAIGFVGFVCHKFGGVFQSKNLYKVRAQTSLSNRKLEKGNSTILDKLRVTIRAATP